MNKDLDLVRRFIAPGIDDGNLSFFMEICRHYGLSPFMRQITPVLRADRQSGEKRLTVVVTVDGLRALAEKTGQYRGQVGPYWCGKEGQWQDVWLASEPPLAAKVGVVREGFAEPIWGIALFREYAQEQGLWRKMPASMLAKCAEAVALRRAFPAVMQFPSAQSPVQVELETEQGDLQRKPVVDAQEAPALPHPQEQEQEIASRGDWQRLYSRAREAGVCQDKQQFLLLCRQAGFESLRIPKAALAQLEQALLEEQHGKGMSK